MAFSDAWDYELQPLAGEPREAVLRRYAAQVQDLYWAGVYWKEAYFRADYSYEDYAPAYCVGYSGWAQYGGLFEEARTSLCANFLRIKGDSRLSWDQAVEPIRAAWRRMEEAGSRSAGHGAVLQN